MECHNMCQRIFLRTFLLNPLYIKSENVIFPILDEESEAQGGKITRLSFHSYIGITMVQTEVLIKRTVGCKMM